jgi:putative two-component system protein, hydrogenase maturation factor HypX/HoxX
VGCDRAAEVRDLAERLARRPDADRSLAAKRRRRARDQAIRPLHAYRAEEMARCQRCFFGPDPGYHEARRRFVYKLRGPDAVPFEGSSTSTASPRSLDGLAA